MVKQKNIPKLRFHEFTGEWERKKLGEVTTKVGIKNKDSVKYPIYSINNKEGFLPQSEQFDGMDSNVRGYDISLYKIIKRNTFAYNPARINVGSIGFSGELNNVIISSLYVCFQTNEQIYDYFFLKYIDTIQFNNSVKSFLEGGVREYLFFENFSKIIFSFPSYPEQKRIASFFTSIDKKISELKKKKNLLEQYKKGVMQKIFSQELKFKDDKGKEFPEWEKKKLREIGEFKNGINKSNEDFGFGYPFINLMDVFGKQTISNLKLGLVNANEKERKLYELKKGDVLFIRSSVKKSGVGETSLVLTDLKDTVYSGFLIRFRDEKIKIDLNFKKYCFSIRKFREDLISLSSTSANTNINQESLNELEITLPSLLEQNKIANFLSAIDEKINRAQMQIEKTEIWKKGLLQLMFC